MPLLITDPIDLLLGDDNDLVIENGDLKFSTGIDAIVQQCRIALQMFQGEWFLNLDAGIPYWQSILGQKPTTAIEAARIFFRRELELVDGVNKITKLDIAYSGSTRTLTITWQVNTVFGDTPVDVIDLRVTTGSE
jgi:hypothetical protein